MFGLKNFLQQISCLCMKSYITLYENVMKYFLHYTKCISQEGKKLKYLKYIRLRLQDHHRSFEHASVYRINSIQNVYFSMDHKEMSW